MIDWFENLKGIAQVTANLGFSFSDCLELTIKEFFEFLEIIKELKN